MAHQHGDVPIDAFLNREDFAKLDRISNGVRIYQGIHDHFPNEEALVHVTVSGRADGVLVTFEPEVQHIERYLAYPCPGVFEKERPTVVRFLSASADQPLQVMTGIVIGGAKPICRVTEGFFLEKGYSTDPDLVAGAGD